MQRAAKLAIPATIAVVLSAFTIAGINDSFYTFITLCVILGAVGLIFMRRKTANDRFYVRSALIATAFCLLAYITTGIYISGQQGSGLSMATFIIFVPVVIPAYLSMSYALAAILRR